MTVNVKPVDDMGFSSWINPGSTIIAALIGALALFILFLLKHRTQRIGIKQYISRVIDPGMLPKPSITFESKQTKFHYPNLYIVEAHLINKSYKSYKNFDLKLSLRVPAEIIYIACQGEDKSHEIIPKQAIDFDNPSDSVDFSLDPFNKNNKYSLTLYVTCTGQNELTKNSIHYSTKKPAKFKSLN